MYLFYFCSLSRFLNPDSRSTKMSFDVCRIGPVVGFGTYRAATGRPERSRHFVQVLEYPLYIYIIIMYKALVF